MTAPSAASSNRVLTVPNVISVVRLSLIPLFVWLLLGADEVVAATVVLAVIGATDWVDGYIARRFDQTSELGKFLDPLADRLAFIVGAAAILIDGSVPRWLCIVVILREAFVGLIALYVGSRGVRRVPVSWDGKVGTFLLMFAFPLLLLGTADTPISTLATVAGWGCAIPGLFYSFKAAIGYVGPARTALAEARVASAAGPATPPASEPPQGKDPSR